MKNNLDTTKNLEIEERFIPMFKKIKALVEKLGALEYEVIDETLTKEKETRDSLKKEFYNELTKSSEYSEILLKNNMSYDSWKEFLDEYILFSYFINKDNSKIRSINLSDFINPLEFNELLKLFKAIRHDNSEQNYEKDNF